MRFLQFGALDVDPFKHVVTVVGIVMSVFAICVTVVLVCEKMDKSPSLPPQGQSSIVDRKS